MSTFHIPRPPNAAAIQQLGGGSHRVPVNDEAADRGARATVRRSAHSRPPMTAIQRP
jgi:hypothetical protein